MKHNHKSNVRPVPTILACALAACLLVAAPPSRAQSVSATLRGVVTANSSPAPNAVITATNVANGYISHGQANADGSYVLAGLQPGTYKVDVSANGKSSSQTVTVQVGQTATLNIPLEGTAAGTPTGNATNLSAVEVVGTRLQETKTSEIATYITTKQIEALPQAGRNFLAFADLVPGVVFTTEPNRHVALRSGGQNSNGINVFIDGVGQKNYVLKGGLVGQDTSAGNPFPQLAISEYKVITSNYKAEYDQVSSAAITAVTRSGTNKFKGEIFGDYTNQDFRAPTVAEEKAGFKIKSADKNYGLSFGGPILRDQLHFFFTYEGKQFAIPVQIRPDQNFTIAQLPPAQQALANATSSAPFKEDLYFGKLDWEPGDNQLLELTGKYRTEKQIDNIGGTNTSSYGTSRVGSETRLDLHYQYSAQRWLNDAHLTYEDASFGPRPTTIAPGYKLTGNLPMFPAQPYQDILNSGGGPDFQDKGQKGTSLQDDLTFTNLNWHGGHTVKMGLKYKMIDINAFEQQPYNAQFFYDINNSLTIPYHVEFGAVTGGGSRDIITRNKQFGTYIQDDWAVNDHLLVNLGIRWDYEQTPAYTSYVTPPALVAALQGWSNIHQPGVDYNINDYISNGSNRHTFKNAWQPRLGFSYDINADQRHVIFGGAGRSYDRNLFDYLALEQSKSTFPTYRFDINSPAHPCVVGPNCLAFNPNLFDPATLAALVAANPNLGSEVNLINNNLKTPYSDQFSIGMRNSFPLWGNDWNTSLTLAHIISRDGIVFTLGNRRPDGTFFPPNTTFGGAPFGFPIPGYGALIIANNGIKTKLNTLLLSLEKPYTRASGWGMTLAYTYSNASENHFSAYQSDDHYVFDYPNLNGLGFTRSLGLSRHRLVMTGIYDAIWGITLSGKLTLASPVPLQALNCHNTTDFNHCFFDPLTPNGTIGYKQFDLAAQKEWNVGPDVKFRIRGDLLNVFNWRNYTDYDTWRGGPSPDFNPTFGQRNGDGITFPTRYFKLTAGLSW